MNEEKWLRTQTLSNVVIAVFTVVLTVVGYYQWRVTQIALNRATQQERPWVVLAEIKKTSPLTVDTSLSFFLVLKNIGHSPAFNVFGEWGHVECDGSPSKKCLETCITDRMLVDRKPIPYGIVGPQQEHIEPFRFSIENPDDIAAIHEGRKTLYFCGAVTFSDIFCIRRVRYYCLYYSGPQNDLSLCPMDYYGFERDLEKCES